LGQPKGVVVPQRGIVNRLHWTQAQYRLESDDRVRHKTSISFDVALWEMWWPMTVGAAVVIAAPGGQRDPGCLCELIRREGVTTAHFVPSLLAEFLNEQSVAASCPGLLRVLSSGERLSSALAERFHQILPARLHNLYGPAEASIDVTAWESRPGAPARHPLARPPAVTAAKNQAVPLCVSAWTARARSGVRSREVRTEECTIEGRVWRRRAEVVWGSFW